MYGMDFFLLESVELWKAWNQIIFYVPNYYCVIVLQESWDHIDRALVFSFYLSFSHNRRDHLRMIFMHAAAEEVGLDLLL